MPIEKLRVFISWSGKRSLAVAEALHDWLPNLFSTIAPWLSASDIEKGARWRQAVQGQLESSNFAIICLTPENLREPWILFEAGAISKRDDSRSCTYLFDLEHADVKDPLSEFQHTKATAGDTRKMVDVINRQLGEAALPNQRLDHIFKTFWPELETRLAAVPEAEDTKQPKRLADPERLLSMVTEILERVRERGRDTSTRRQLADREAPDPGNILTPEAYENLKSILTTADFGELVRTARDGAGTHFVEVGNHFFETTPNVLRRIAAGDLQPSILWALGPHSAPPQGAQVITVHPIATPHVPRDVSRRADRARRQGNKRKP